MNIVTRYTWANIKGNLSRIPLIVACVAIAVLMFAISNAVPVVMNNFAVHATATIYGSSDIYIANSSDNNNQITSFSHMPQEVFEKSEYVVGIFTIQGTEKHGESTKRSNLIGVSLEDLNKFNPPEIEEGKTGFLDKDEVVVSRYLADEQGLMVGSKLRFTYGSKIETLNVVAIAADAGIFSWHSENNIVTSKETVKSIVGSYVPVDAMFNACVIKLKDNSAASFEEVKGLIRSAYPDWGVYNSFDKEKIDSIVKHNSGPIMICTYFVVVYCLFIIYLTMEIVFKSRTRQFATMKCIGATNKTQYGSLLSESLIYGGIGGAIGTLLAKCVFWITNALPQYDYLFKNITWEYYFTAFLFGFIFAIISSVIPAVKNVNKSVRQTMVTKPASKKYYKTIQIIAICVYLVSIIGTILQPKGRLIYLSPIFFLGIFLTSLLLIPYILRYLLILFAKITKKRSFSMLYTQNSFVSASLRTVSRIMFFSISLIALLITCVNTIATVSERTAEVDYYSVRISNINDGNLSPIQNAVNSQSFVNGTDIGTFYSDVKFINADGKTGVINWFNGLELQTIKDVYRDQITSDATEVFEKLMTDRNYIMPNVKFQYLYNLDIGDEIEVEIPVGSEIIVSKLIVAGFVDSGENYCDIAIMNMQALNKIVGRTEGNSVLINVDRENEDQLLSYIQTRYATTYQVVSLFETWDINIESSMVPIAVFKIYSVLMGIMSLVFVIVALYLSLRQMLHAHKTMNTLGMGRKEFILTGLYQILYICIASTVIGLANLALSKKLMINILCFFDFYFRVSIPWATTIAFVALLIVFITISATIINALHSRQFDKHERKNDE